MLSRRGEALIGLGGATVGIALVVWSHWYYSQQLLGNPPNADQIRGRDQGLIVLLIVCLIGLSYGIYELVQTNRRA
jgi:cell division protein FtsX